MLIKMASEKHLSSVSRAAFQRLGIMRKSWQLFHDRTLLLSDFCSFVLPVLVYCLAVWCSASDSHLKLPGRVVRSDVLLAGGVLECYTNQFSITSGQVWLGPILCTGKWVKKYSPAVESSTWPLNSHNCSENYPKTNTKTKTLPIDDP